MLKKLGIISMTVGVLAGCASPQTYTPATRIVQKPVIIQPPSIKMNYSLRYGNNPALAKAYNTFLKTGKTPNVITDGFEQFAYGVGQQPIINVSPLELTVISLEPGEKVTNVSSGDPLRWSYSMAISGQGDSIQYNVMVKPNYPNVVTNLVITTDKRVYILKLISGAVGNKYISNIKFWYPDEIQTFWQNYNAQQAQKITQSDTVADVPNINVKDLNFSYSAACGGGVFSSCPSWKPIRVFDDGTHTYIQFPQNISSANLPALFILNGRSQELVNYRTKFPYFVVDKIFKQAVLIIGVGSDQSRVVITNNNYS